MDLITGIQKTITSSQGVQKISRTSIPIQHLSLKKDVFTCSKTPSQIINAQLKKLYGINSDIENTSLLIKLKRSIEDFCRLNQDKTMFEGLKVSSENLGRNYLSKSFVDTETSAFNIVFNNKINWKNIGELTQEIYDSGKIASNNPLYVFYKELGNYLNFSYNPYAHKVCQKRFFIQGTDCEKVALRLSDSLNLSDFNSHYIAAKMSGVTLPKKMGEIFLENAGNTDLKFPKVAVEFLQGKNCDFSSIQEACEHLKKYGINAEFTNLSQANLCATAVEDLIAATGNEKIFDGLKITNNINAFDECSAFGCMSWMYNHNTGANTSELILNPAYNWGKVTQMALRDYENCFHPSGDSKTNFIHELAHYLDFKGNPKRYADISDDFNNRGHYYNDFGKLITSKVSEYASKEPAEFCAEYICARFAGLQYPKITNEEFLNSWNGAALNFPR